MATKGVNRHFCSNLVAVQLLEHGDTIREVIGNLEEISTSGASVNVEQAVDTGLALRIICSGLYGTVEFLGQVVDSQHDAHTGYHLQIEFSPGSQWSPEVFRPKHMIRVSSLVPANSQQPSREASFCERGVCPQGVIARVLEPGIPLTHRIRTVAREVATLCGDLTPEEASVCFRTLFGACSECSLNDEFLKANNRKRSASQQPNQKSRRK